MIRRLDLLLCGFEKVMMVGLTLLGVCMGLLQIILRYVFNSGIHWLETALVISLVWAMLFGASRAVREGFHPRVDLLAMTVGPKVRAVLNILAYGATLALCLYYAYDSIFYARFLSMIGAVNQETDLPELYFFLVVPITMVFFSLRYLMLLIKLGKDIGALKPEETYLAKLAAEKGQGK
ncbi:MULTISPECIES: TRAP transporter small permease [unclassified Thalassospira]|jgi:C4-dicarboxylate transporter DctQ subunit|uniref:TRAP transporter small permease n=1 Tax=unclassified Thalassospira TaxID=2648997 RepID=UPI000A1D928D|nr:TRAP transporter small permease [Thalassospira sp. MCCC 1A01428]OSQ45422.1 hypothetical protein THS27_03480 [Thalassospira sp. MCCC 1A01428]